MVKFPDNAKKVFSGVLYDVYHWEQEMFDGSFETFEGLRRNGGAGMVCVTPDNKIIVLDEEQPSIGKFRGLPGGCREDNETGTMLDVAKRELLEETGYEAKHWEVIHHVDGHSGIELSMPETTYLAKYSKKVADLKLDAGEKIIVKFMNFEEFLQCCRDPDFRCQEHFRIYMYECLLDENKKEEFRKRLFD